MSSHLHRWFTPAASPSLVKITGTGVVRTDIILQPRAWKKLELNDPRKQIISTQVTSCESFFPLHFVSYFRNVKPYLNILATNIIKQDFVPACRCRHKTRLIYGVRHKHPQCITTRSVSYPRSNDKGLIQLTGQSRTTPGNQTRGNTWKL